MIRGGYLKRILSIDLTKGATAVREVADGFALTYIGGRGWGAKIVFDEVPPDADPLAPDNVLVIASGPLTGTLTVSCGKLSLVGISPLTRLYGDSSIGGSFGPTLKQAGFDAIVLRGRATKPIYIVIDDGEVELRAADHLWGLGCLDAEEAILEDLGAEFSVLTIGPAGENLVKFACVSSDLGRQAGRTGMGAILGSKQVKAIAARGSHDIPIADAESMMKLLDEVLERLLSHGMLKPLRKQGTMMIVEWSQKNECLPTRNFRSSIFEQFEGISGKAFESWKVADRACFPAVQPLPPLEPASARLYSSSCSSDRLKLGGIAMGGGTNQRARHSSPLARAFWLPSRHMGIAMPVASREAAPLFCILLCLVPSFVCCVVGVRDLVHRAGMPCTSSSTASFCWNALYQIWYSI